MSVFLLALVAWIVLGTLGIVFLALVLEVLRRRRVRRREAARTMTFDFESWESRLRS